MKRNYPHFAIAASILLMGLAPSVIQAATINVNIGSSATTVTNPGYGLWGEGANTWNVVTGPTNNLVDSAGAATTVDFTYTGWGNSNGNSGWGPDDLTNYGKYGPNDDTTTHTLTISQLSAGQAYEILFYFSDGFPNETMTAEGAGPDAFTGSKTTTGGTTYVEGPLTTGGIFSYFNNVTADGSGDISVTASGAGYETITGFQIRAIPEPSAALLGGLGALLLLRRRR